MLCKCSQTFPSVWTFTSSSCLFPFLLKKFYDSKLRFHSRGSRPTLRLIYWTKTTPRVLLLNKPWFSFCDHLSPSEPGCNYLRAVMEDEALLEQWVRAARSPVPAVTAHRPPRWNLTCTFGSVDVPVTGKLSATQGAKSSDTNWPAELPAVLCVSEDQRIICGCWSRALFILSHSEISHS